VNDLDDRDPLDRLAEEFLARSRRGDRPTIGEYVALHPDRANEIRDLISALLMVEGARSHADPTLGPDGASGRRGEPTLERLGDFRIVREVGRGGMGVVYEAEQESLGRTVALKVLSKRSLAAADQVLRFLREARAAARLHHTNIVPVFGVGEHDGLHYYVMQFIRGPGLDEVIEEMRRLEGPPGESSGDARTRVGIDRSAAEVARSLVGRPEDRPSGDDGEPPPAAPRPAGVAPTSEPSRRYARTVARMMMQAAEAIDHAHAQGILHRDVKPSNLLLDAQGTVWVTDFGLAKATEDDDLTRTGDLVGTLRYMAPERFRGECDARSDVYSLGLTLYELLAGRPAFEVPERDQLIYRVTHTSPPRLWSVRPSVPRDLDTVVHKAIEREPKDRYATAGDFARDLGRFLADRPVKARRTSAAERLVRWSRRNPAPAGLGAAVLFLLAAIAIGSTAAAVSLGRRHAEAVAAGVKAKERLWESYLAQSRSRRRGFEAGRRFESLANVAAAAGLGVNADRRWVLRDEAIACLAVADLRRTDCGLHPPIRRGDGLGFDADFTRCAYRAADGRVIVRGLPDDRVVADLPGPPLRPVGFRFSPDGKLLASRCDENGRTGFAAWDIERGEVVLGVPQGVEADAFEFSPDGRWLAAGRLDGSIEVYDTATLRVARRLPPGAIPHALAFDPEGRRLAVSGPAPESAIQVRSFADGAIERSIPLPAGTYAITWHPDGRRIAAGGRDGRIYLVDAGTNDAKPEVFEGHQGAVVSLSFHPDRDLLASGSWDGTLRLWEVGTRVPLVRTDMPDPGPLRFSRDGTLLGPGRDGEQVWLWEVAPGRECSAVADAEGPPATWQLEFWPEHGLLVATGAGGLRFDSPSVARTIASLDLPGTAASAFNPDGSELFTGGDAGLLRWPVTRAESSLRIGPPEPFGLPAGLPTGRIRLSPDGLTLAIVSDWERGRVVVLRLDQPERKVEIASHPGLERIAFSPDGRLLATGTWKGDGVKVWDVASGKLVTTLDVDGSAEVLFRPDGRRLLTGCGREYREWDIRTWAPGSGIDRVNTGGLPGVMSYSADGKTLALVRSRSVVQLVEPETFEVLTTLVPPELRNASSLGFSSDGARLAVSHNSRVLTLWDLRTVRAGLASVGLDFERPPLPPSASEPDAPTAIHVDLPPWRDEVFAAEGYAEAGRWEEAAEAYAAAFAAGNRSPRDWARRSLVLLRLRRTGEYAQHCEAMTRHFGAEVNPGLANGLAWACAVGPGAADEAAVRLAESAGTGDGHVRLNTLGAVYYRAGRFEEAESVLHRSLAAHGSGGAAEDWVFLAMTCHRLGRLEEAKAWLERLGPAGPTVGGGGTGGWAAVLERHLLDEEARQVVGREP